MSFRGRGRGGGGRGRGGGGYGFLRVKPEPFINFPDNLNLPSDPAFPLPQEELDLITWKVRLENFLKESCYHLQEASSKSKKQEAEMERYSDRFKSKLQVKRESLASYLKLTTLNFPAELIQGSKRVQSDNKKSKELQWGRGSDKELLDMFEKLEENDKGDKNEVKEKKAESEDEEEAGEEAEEESSDDDDYNQNIDFDDDEDDLNMVEEADEDTY